MSMVSWLILYAIGYVAIGVVFAWFMHAYEVYSESDEDAIMALVLCWPLAAIIFLPEFLVRTIDWLASSDPRDPKDELGAVGKMLHRAEARVQELEEEAKDE